ncbi:ester cyclase [Cobetia amphilecti]|uniref:nuclear transport factor 2 family protein n=1 Tax=Cobetia amphilecti TaxID=1055104 RepID=UPI003297E617
MSLNGFDERFTDLRDYILTITEWIWEGRGIDLIRDYYAEDCPVKAPAGAFTGVEGVIRGTLETLQEFPDRTLLGEDVIGSEDAPGTYYSSHRIFSHMTHQGEGAFGAPTGIRAGVMTVADCLCREDRIVDEWLVRDQAGLALQLGHSPEAMGRALAEKASMPGQEALVDRWRGPEGDLDIEALGPIAERYRDLWQYGRLERLRTGYDRAIDTKVPGARTLRGHDDLERFWFGYKAAFPAGIFRVHHWIDREDAGAPRRISLRWSLQTTHQGSGVFGPASGAPVVLLGITHAELRGDIVVREWHQLDEIAIHAQIAQHRQQEVS